MKLVKIWTLLLVLGLAMAILVGCGSDDDPTTPPAGTDTTAPLVVSTSPDGGEVDVSVDETILVTFNEAMDPATAAGNVTLSAGSVSGLVWNSDRVLAVSHAASWNEGSEITVTVGTGLTDVAGNALAAPFSFSFWTESTTELLLLDTTPGDGATGVNRDVGIILVFSADLLSASVSANVTISDAAPLKAVFPFTVEDLADGVMLLRPDETLPASTMIWVTVNAGLTAQNETVLASTQTFSFTTGTDVDNTPPTVVATDPANGSTNVPADKGYLRMTFSEAMDPDSLEPSSWNFAFFRLVEASQTSPIWSENNTVVTVELPNPLPSGMPVELNFDSISDLAGNTIASTFTYEFKIAGAADYVPVVEGEQYIEEIYWEEGTVNPMTTTDSGTEQRFLEFGGLSGSSFRITEYTDGTFATPNGDWEEYNKSGSALEWTGFEDADKGADRPGSDLPGLRRFTDFESPLTILPLPLAAGTWTDNSAITFPGEGRFLATLNGEVEAKVDLPIPDSGGVVFFKDAWRVTITLDVELESSGETFTQEYTTWYAPTTGEVHRIGVETDPEFWFSEDAWRFPVMITKRAGQGWLR